MASYPGRFLDGRTAQPHDVTVSATDAGVAIDEHGERLALWPWLSLTSEKTVASDDVRLGCAGRGLATLTVQNAEFAAQVRERAPHLTRVLRHEQGGLVAAAVYGLVTVAAFAAIYFGVTHAAALVVRLVPEDVERRWGAEYAEAFGADKGGTCEAPEGRAALERLVARLTTAADGRPVEVHVVDAPIVNAFALPGRQILLFRGLIEKAGSPDEVAGVLGHEMGHVAERHALRRLIEQIGIAGAIGLVFGGGGWQQGDMVATLLDLSYSRAMEEEADRYAVDLLREADIRRDGIVSFFRRLAEMGGDAPLALLSTHPDSGARAALVDTSGGGGPAMSEADWTALRRICGEPKE